MWVLKQIKSTLKDEAFRAIIGRSLKLMIINFSGVILLFVTNYFLVKLSDEKIYGEYVTINVWLAVLNIVVVFGMDDLFILVLPKKAGGYPKGIPAPSIFKWALKICSILLIVVLSVAGLFFFNSPRSEWFKDYVVYLAILTVLMASFNLFNAFFRGINMIAEGQLIEKIARPGIMLLLIVVFYIFNLSISLHKVLLILALSIFAGIIIFAFEFSKRFSLPFKNYNPHDASGKSNLSFLGISLLYFLSTRLDILMLTAYSTPEQVGHYNIAARIADIIGYPLTALYLVVPTLLSREWVFNRIKAIEVLKNIALFSFAIITISLIFLLFFGEYALAFFGKNFVYSYWPMMLLSSVHLFSAFSLPLNTLLMVSGKQKFSLMALFGYVVFIIMLSFIIIPGLGARGAALTMLCGSLFYLVFISVISFNIYKKNFKYNKRLHWKEV